MANNSKILVDELCQVITSFLCQPGTAIDISKCQVGPHVFAKGGTQPVCTVKLTHGQIYNLEFVYRFWMHKLCALKYPFSPFFVITNNGLSTTLKCFLCEPRDAVLQFGQCFKIDFDVYLYKNSSVILSQDDFMKFKTNLLFAKDLDIFNSMVVCRTYLTDHRQALQFLVVKPKNYRRVYNLLNMIAEAVGVKDYKDDMDRYCLTRKPIKPQLSHKRSHTSSKNNLDDTDDSTYQKTSNNDKLQEPTQLDKLNETENSLVKFFKRGGKYKHFLIGGSIALHLILFWSIIVVFYLWILKP